MDTYRAPSRAKAKPDHAAADADDSDELGVFAAERYFYGADDDDALWPWPWPCERSSSSLSSAFRTGAAGTHDPSVPTPTAVTSSSEASWNSRSALLPNTSEPPDKLHDVAVVAPAATPFMEARRSVSGSGAEVEAGGQRDGTRPASSSSSNLRRWLQLGVAACGCAGGVSEEEVEESVISTDEASERFPETEIVPESTITAASVVAPGSARWLLESDRTLAGIATDGHRHRRASATNFHYPETGAAAITDSDERRRIKSLEMFRPRPVPVVVGDHGNALGSATQSSAFTIVAGNTALGDGAPAPAPAPAPARGGAVTGRGRGGSPAGEDDDAAVPSELGCAAAYAPSEASVVWSVVTADGAASGNFSSAASGYYYRYYLNNDAAGDDGGTRRAAAAAAKSTSTRRRRSGIASGSSLLTCISDRAVDAVGPALPPVHRPAAGGPAGYRGNDGRFCGQPPA